MLSDQARNKAQSTLHTWVVVDARSIIKHVDQSNSIVRRFQVVDVGAQKSGDLLQAQEWRLGT